MDDATKDARHYKVEVYSESPNKAMDCNPARNIYYRDSDDSMADGWKIGLHADNDRSVNKWICGDRARRMAHGKRIDGDTVHHVETCYWPLSYYQPVSDVSKAHKNLWCIQCMGSKIQPKTHDKPCAACDGTGYGKERP